MVVFNQQVYLPLEMRKVFYIRSMWRRLMMTVTVVAFLGRLLIIAPITKFTTLILLCLTVPVMVIMFLGRLLLPAPLKRLTILVSKMFLHSAFGTHHFVGASKLRFW
jgi:hypothetical protein